MFTTHDPKTGAEIWRTDKSPLSSIQTPSVSGGKARTFDKEEWTKELEGWTSFFKSDGMKNGTMALKMGGKGGMDDAPVLWTETKGIPEVPSPLLYHDRLYYIRNGGLFTCRDAKTGKSLYDERIGAPGAYYSSPVGAGGRIYTASDRGVVTVLKAGDTFEKISQVDLKEPISATPPVLGCVLYVRTDRHLYAFGK